MCFVNDDYAWIAEEHTITDGPAAKAVACDECRGVIHAGEWRRLVFMQQYELCQVCEDGDSERYVVGDDDEDPPPCPDDEHDFGESCEFVQCERCVKLLAAIKAAELEEGCAEDESQPNYGALLEAMTDRFDGGDVYAEKARQMFPELAESGHLRRMGQEFDRSAGWAVRDLEPVEAYGGEGG